MFMFLDGVNYVGSLVRNESTSSRRGWTGEVISQNYKRVLVRYIRSKTEVVDQWYNKGRWQYLYVAVAEITPEPLHLDEFHKVLEKKYSLDTWLGRPSFNERVSAEYQRWIDTVKKPYVPVVYKPEQIYFEIIKPMYHSIYLSYLLRGHGTTLRGAIDLYKPLHSEASYYEFKKAVKEAYREFNKKVKIRYPAY
jgi:hypothetical protein